MYARVVVVFVFPSSRGDQVPLQKDVKVNWVRPGQVVHESQQVATFLDINVTPDAGGRNQNAMGPLFLECCCAFVSRSHGCEK